MTQINKERMTHLADQSRLYFSDDEIDVYMKQLNDTLSLTDKINELNTENVSPTTNGNQNINVIRKDTPVVWEERDAALENAPAHDGSHFEVPTIMD